MARVVGAGSRAGKNRAGDRRYGAGDVDVGMARGRLHRTLREVSHVGRIDAPPVAAGKRVEGIEGLVPTQRHPGIHRSATGSQTPPRTAVERDQGRRVNRTRRIRAGTPTPTRAEPYPAPVVERRITPARIVDPGPTPRAHPRPTTVTIRDPAAHDGSVKRYR